MLLKLLLLLLLVLVVVPPQAAFSVLVLVAVEVIQSGYSRKLNAERRSATAR